MKEKRENGIPNGKTRPVVDSNGNSKLNGEAVRDVENFSSQEEKNPKIFSSKEKGTTSCYLSGALFAS